MLRHCREGPQVQHNWLSSLIVFSTRGAVPVKQCVVLSSWLEMG